MTPAPGRLFLQDEGLAYEGIAFGSLPPNYVAWFLIPLGLAAFAWLCYRRERNAPFGMRVGLTALRTLALFFVIFLLFEPYRQFRQVEEIRSMVTVLVDASSSMARHDPYEEDPVRADAVLQAAGLAGGADPRAHSRSDLMKRTLGEDGLGLLARLREKHDVRAYAFSTGRPQGIERIEDATDDGPVTAIGDALAFVLADPDVQSKPDAHVVLISDGRSTTGAAPVDVARHAGETDRIAVYTVGVGDPEALRDIELRFIRADEVALKGNTVHMELTVRNDGFETGFVTVTVRDESGRSWMPARSMRLLASDEDQTLEIDFVADRVGTFTLDVTVQGPAGEENVANNTRKHTLTVKDDKINVLYVDTLPRWEYRRLKNFLVRGDQAFVTRCLLLSAEAEFPQETTPGVEPLRRFPETFEELDAYDVLIFGDVNPSLLVATPSKLTETLRNIQRFVDAGGGLAVVAGEGWTPAAYADTPLEEILPVDIGFDGDQGPLQAYVDEWKPTLSAFGRTHPITQITDDVERNERYWEEKNLVPLKGLRWWYPVRKATPAAQVLAYHPFERNRFGYVPLLVTGVHGDGPVYFAGIDETWRWFYESGPVYFNRYWGNVVRYLARTHLYRGSKRYKLATDRSEYQQGQTVRFTAWVKDKGFRPATMPTQRLMIAEPDGENRLVEMRKTDDGVYVLGFNPARYGRHEAWIVGDEGLAGPRYAPVSFDVNYIDPEARNPAMDQESLREIAAASGGTYFRLEDAGGLFEKLRADTTRRSRIETRPLKSRFWLPAILLALLTAEWLTRRRMNMV